MQLSFNLKTNAPEDMRCMLCVTKEADIGRESSRNVFSWFKIRITLDLGMPSNLIKFYVVSDYILKLDMFYFRSVAENSKIDLCAFSSWLSSLNRVEESEEINPPKFSIANGFAIGYLPLSLQNMTITEHRLKYLAYFGGHIVIARGGSYKFIKSHILVCSTQPERESIFTSSMTTAQRKMTMERYEARREKVNSLLQFYMKIISSTNSLMTQKLSPKCHKHHMSSFMRWLPNRAREGSNCI